MEACFTTAAALGDESLLDGMVCFDGLIFFLSACRMGALARRTACWGALCGAEYQDTANMCMQSNHAVDASVGVRISARVFDRWVMRVVQDPAFRADGVVNSLLLFLVQRLTGGFCVWCRMPLSALLAL